MQWSLNYKDETKLRRRTARYRIFKGLTRGKNLEHEDSDMLNVLEPLDEESLCQIVLSTL